MSLSLGSTNICHIQSLATLGRWVAPIMQVTHQVVGIPRSMQNPLPTSYEACSDEKMGVAGIYFVAMSGLTGLCLYTAGKDIYNAVTNIRAGHTRDGLAHLATATEFAAFSAILFFGSKYIFY